METRFLPNQPGSARFTTDELRSAFVLENLFEKNKISLTYIETDRAIVGSAVATDKPLKLESSKKEMAADYFCERREVGVINIGMPGVITVDGKEFVLGNRELLYIGRGSKEIFFSSKDP
ncbi:MAG: 5-dehydro-4-deoxy-D-glucuronate isomerase, partial [Ignavibacteriae bacterium HGW-Ignavibacteriae-3]